jgi:hypothetical protein
MRALGQLTTEVVVETSFFIGGAGQLLSGVAPRLSESWQNAESSLIPGTRDSRSPTLGPWSASRDQGCGPGFFSRNLEKNLMSKKMTALTMLGGAGVAAALVLAPMAGAEPSTPPPVPTNPNAWAQNIQICAATSCYPGGGSRGSYVSTVAPTGPQGYASTLMQHAQDPPGGTTTGVGPANSSFGQGQTGKSPF